jgi:hypothetical protein
MTNDRHAWSIPLEGWLGVATTEIPHLDLFLKSAETSGGGAQSDARSKMANTEWARHLWTCISGIGKVSQVVPLVAEFAVLEDKRRLRANQALYFVSNIVCELEPAYADRAIDAYRAALNTIKGAGSTVMYSVFQSQLCICVESQQLERPISYRESDSGGTTSPLIRLAAREKVDNILNPDVQFDEDVVTEHSQQFFRAFLSELEPKSGPFAGSFFVIVPFQRPAVRTDETVTAEENPAAPGGAIIAICRLQQTSAHQPRLGDAVQGFAVRLRHMIGQAHMKEASRFIDIELAREAQLANTLLAYSEMGHALRPLVSATGHASAAKALELTKMEPDISTAGKKRIDQALRALYSFEHVEAFGSLLRLSTWLVSEGPQRVEQIRKLKKCFDPLTVERVRRGDLEQEVSAGYVELVTRLARGLAPTFKVAFRVRSAHPNSAETIKITSGDSTYHALAEVDLPPLTATGDRTPVLLTMVTALLEPLSNAASYLNRKPQGDAPVDVVVALRPHGTCSIFIGNLVLDVDRSTRDDVAAIPGVRMTSRLLEDAMLGCIRPVSVQDYASLRDFESHQRHAGSSMMWICVEFTPLRLYDDDPELRGNGRTISR